MLTDITAQCLICGIKYSRQQVGSTPSFLFLAKAHRLSPVPAFSEYSSQDFPPAARPPALFLLVYLADGTGGAHGPEVLLMHIK